MKKLRVTVEGKSYEVVVEMLDEPKSSSQQASAPVVSAPIVSASVVAPKVAAVAKPVPAGAGDVVSPLAGKVVSIEVKVGQQVTEGQQVATIEAMKMNTYIYAGHAGTVSAIPVAAGDGVNEGDILVTIA